MSKVSKSQLFGCFGVLIVVSVCSHVCAESDVCYKTDQSCRAKESSYSNGNQRKKPVAWIHGPSVRKKGDIIDTNVNYHIVLCLIH